MSTQLFFPMACEYTPRRLVLPGDLDVEGFARLAVTVRRCAEASHFWAVDLLGKGLERFGQVETVRVLREAGFSDEELKVLNRLGALPAELRRESLSLEHHLVVASAPGERQLEWMSIAEESQCSPAELRRSIAKGYLVREGNGESPDGSGSERSNFSFCTIQAIEAEFKIWLRQCSREFEDRNVKWARGILESTRVLRATMKEIERMAGLEGEEVGA